MTFVKVAGLDQISNAHPLAVQVDGVNIALVRQGNDVYALKNQCSHGLVRLSEGDVEDGAISCSRHGAEFDVKTGAALSMPATTGVAVYPVKVCDGDVFVDVSAEEN